MKKTLTSRLLMLALAFFSFTEIFAGTIVVLPGNNSTSGNGRAPQGTRTFIRTAYLITAAEMTASGFGAQTVDKVGWHYNVPFPPAAAAPLAQNITTTGNIKIYLQNTTDLGYSKGLNFATAIVGMTLVTDGVMTIPAGLAEFTVDVNSGGPGTSVFTTVAGQGVYVVFDYETILPLATPAGAPTVFCTTTLTNGVNGAATYQSNVVNGTAMTTTNFRPETRFSHIIANDISVGNIYTLGSMPLGYATNHIIQARITNLGDDPQTNISVSLAISNANVFNDVQVIASLASGASAIVSFAPFTPSATGTNAIAVSIPNDDNNLNNSNTMSQSITSSIFSYKYAAPNTGGVGFNGASGDFIGQFTTSNNNGNPDTIQEVKVDFTTNGQPYQLGIWDNTGPGGTPGANIYTSSTLNTAIGTAFIPVPNVVVNGTFYVGIRQTGIVNVGFAYQTESPVRGSKFYYTSPTGNTAWVDFNPGADFRLGIDVVLFVPTPPNCAINMLPADASAMCTSGSPLNIDLSWASGGGGPTSYDLYFGTNPNPPFVTNTALTTYNAGILAPGTYYWYVVPQNAFGLANGCSTSLSFIVDAPVSGIITGGAAVCQGAPATNLTLTFTGTAPWTYSINGGAPQITNTSPVIMPVNPVITTVYSITSISDAICIGVAGSSTTVIVSANPVINSVTAVPAIVCQGTPSVLTANVNLANTITTFTQNTPTAILDNSTTTSTLNVSGLSVPTLSAGNVLEVGVRLDHTWDSDVSLWLEAPGGAVNQFELTTNNGGSGDNYGTGTGGGIVYTIFGSGATNLITAGSAPFVAQNPYKPEGLFSSLDGSTSNGNWTLRINDNATQDQGTLLSWYIKFSTPNTYTYQWTPSGGSMVPANGQASSVSVTPNTNTNYSVTVTNPASNCFAVGNTSVTVNPLASASISGGALLCEGNCTSIHLVFSGGGGAPYNVTLSDGSNYTSATNSLFVTKCPSTSTTYTITSVNGANLCPSANVSGSAVVNVNPAPQGGAATPATSIICQNTSTALTLINYVGNIQWQISTDNVNWNNIPLQTSSTLNTGNLSATRYYRALTTTGGCNYLVASSTATVNVPSSMSASMSNVTSNSADVSWSPVGGGSFFDVFWSGTAGTGSALGQTGNSYSITGLSAAGSLSVTVNMVTPNCGLSAITSTTTLCAAATGLSLLGATNTTLQIQWTSGNGSVTDTVYYRNVTANGNYLKKGVAPGAPASTTLSSLTANATYEVYVRSSCSGSTPSNSLSGIYQTTGAGICVIPTITSVTSPCPNLIQVNWGGSGIGPDYKISYRRIAPTTSSLTTYTVTGSTTYTISAVAPGATYEISVRSLCAGGSMSAGSSPSIFTAPSNCGPVENVVVSNAYCHGFVVSWRSLSCATAGYKVYFRHIGNANWTSYNTNSISDTTFSFTTLNLSIGYEIYVAPRQTGCGSYIGIGSSILTVPAMGSCREDGLVSDDVTVSGAMNVYPNPNEGQFTVSYSTEKAEVVKIEVMNVLGQVVYSYLTNETEGIHTHLIALNEMNAAGTYFVRVSAGDAIQTKRVIVSH